MNSSQSKFQSKKLLVHQRRTCVVLHITVAQPAVTDGCLQGAGSSDQFFPPQAWRGAEMACWSPSIPLITPTQPRLVRQGGRLPVRLSGLTPSETGAEFWSVSSSSLSYPISPLTVVCEWLPPHKWWTLSEAVSQLPLNRSGNVQKPQEILFLFSSYIRKLHWTVTSIIEMAR